MTLTHLPTRVSVYANQTLGFASAAEGFIFLSALLCGRVFSRKLEQEGARSVWKRLGARAGRLYGYHLLLLAVAFTAVALLAIRTQQPSLQGLLDFYLAHPVDGVIASIFLIYRPPLLDILPMYILFLVLTPVVLWAGRRFGWRVILIPSLLLWAGAQIGMRWWLYAVLVRVTHADIPFGALGAFDLYGWQLLWIGGLWVGAGLPGAPGLRLHPRIAMFLSLIVAATCVIVRHTPLWDVLNAPPWTPLTDKWHLGSIRILNFTALTILFAAVQQRTVQWLGRGPLVLLGQASLEVFCAHLLVCFAALAWVGDGTNAPVFPQTVIIVGALAFLYLTAKVFAKRRAGAAHSRRED
jgi:hypothetical protein